MHYISATECMDEKQIELHSPMILCKKYHASHIHTNMLDRKNKQFIKISAKYNELKYFISEREREKVIYSVQNKIHKSYILLFSPY